MKSKLIAGDKVSWKYEHENGRVTWRTGVIFTSTDDEYGNIEVYYRGRVIKIHRYDLYLTALAKPLKA